MYAQAAADLGVGVTTLRATVNGRRWVTLAQLGRAERSHVLGARFRDELRFYLSRDAKVPQGSQDPATRSSPTGSLVEGRFMASPRTTHPDMQAELHSLVEAARADVERALQVVARARRAGVWVNPLADWEALRGLLLPAAAPQGVPPEPQARERVAALQQSLPAWQVLHLSDAVRAVFADGKSRTSAEVKALLVGVGHRARTAAGGQVPADEAAVDRALARLTARGELERTGRGTYQATGRLDTGGVSEE